MRPIWLYTWVLVCLALAAAACAGNPSISVVDVSLGVMTGRVMNMPDYYHKDHYVYTYFLVNGTWNSGPTVELDYYGSFSLRPLEPYKLMRVFVSAVNLPQYSRLDFAKWEAWKFHTALAHLSYSAQFISFAGYDTWYVKDGSGMGPGPNEWSRDPTRVWVDRLGLHLTVAPLESSGSPRWVCTEVELQNQYFGHGMYYWVVRGKFAQLDKQLVVGVFTYDMAETSAPGYGEIDFEWSKWGQQTKKELFSFTVHPFPDGDPRAHIEYNTNNGEVFTLLLDWQPGRIEQWLFNGYLTPSKAMEFPQTPFHWIYEGANAMQQPRTATVHMNFWLFRGTAPTSGNRRYEYIIQDFQFSS